ncbi:MAG: GNAT family N-acetyltransferase [Polyangiales bacterium]
MNVDIERADRAQHDVLRHLLHLYVYDFSEILGLEIEESGRFAERPVEIYWEDARWHPFFIRAGGRLAGFALVHRGSRLSGDPEVWDMAEFFVLRKHRRAGVGMEAAHRIFALHPGRWEVRQRSENVAATAFWRRAIGAWASDFTETLVEDSRWQGPVQHFTQKVGQGR